MLREGVQKYDNTSRSIQVNYKLAFFKKNPIERSTAAADNDDDILVWFGYCLTSR